MIERDGNKHHNEFSFNSEQKELSDLQMRLGQFTDRLQDLAYLASQAKDNSQADLAHHMIYEYDALYREIPADHHLQVGLTPIAGKRLLEDKALKSAVATSKAEGGTEYYLNVNPWISGISDVKEGSRCINMHVIGQTGEKPQAKFGFMEVNSQSMKELSTSLSVTDVLSMYVVGADKTLAASGK